MAEDDLWWSYDLNDSLGDANADMAKTSPSVREIVVNADLVKTPAGQLLAVATLPDLSLGQKLSEFRREFGQFEKSPGDCVREAFQNGISLLQKPPFLGQGIDESHPEYSRVQSEFEKLRQEMQGAFGIVMGFPASRVRNIVND